MTTQAPPPGGNQHENKGKRFAIVAILLVVIAGLGTAAGLVMVNRSDDTATDDPQYVVMDTPITTPVFEPRDAAGNDPFFPLDTQLLTYQTEVEEQIDSQMAIAQANAEPGETVVRPAFDVAALDEAVKTGLYGGTEENTCDPERLISFLYANPDLLEAWAGVQGIPVSQVAEYIRSLEVRVLAEPVNVLNHGFDFDTSAPYEIDTVLDAGTAVLVDENGDIRTRCYCGNPIKPKPPVHMPPRCIVYGAFVSVVPGGGDRRDGAPTDVLLTGRQTTIAGATWLEVTWGTGDAETGWVRSDNLRTHYCPTPTNDRYCPGPDATPVWHTPDNSDQVGQVTGKVRTVDTTLDIFAPLSPVGGVGNEIIQDNFMLIRFKEGAPSIQNSAWVELADLNQDSTKCERIRQCVDTEGPIWERASAGLLPNPGGIQWVEFTGHFIGDPLVTFAEVRLNDGTGAYGWINNFYTPLADSDCEPVYDCVELADLFETPEQELPERLGQLNNIDVDILGGPENGRMQVQVGTDGPIGWVDQTEFFDGHNRCEHPPQCYQTAVAAWTVFSTSGDSIPPQGPTTMTPNGARVWDDVTMGWYEYINIGGTDYWVEIMALQPLDPERCEPEANPPECVEVRPHPGSEFTPDGSDPRNADEATLQWDLLAGGPKFPELDGLDTADGDDDGENPGDGDGDGDDDDGEEPGDDGHGFSECCVQALYLSQNVGDPSGDPVPTYVFALDSSEVDGETWFQTFGPRYFRQADVVSADECEQPECPEPNRIPGRGEIYDSLRDLKSLELTSGRILVTEELPDPELPEPGDEPVDPGSDECCVSRLFTGQGVGELVLIRPQAVEVASGPHDMAPAWYMTTDGHWFPETAVVDASLCDVPVHCPVDVDPTGPGSGPRNDDTPTKLLDDATSDTFLVGFAVNGIAGIPSTWCCVDGDVLNGPGGVLKGTLDGPTRVILVDSTEDGGWHEILIDGPIGDGWVQTVQFLPSALEDCERDEVECPRTSIMGTQLDEEGNTLYICCVEVTNANGAVEYMPVLVDPTNIDGLVFVDAELCEQVVECPIPGSIISDNDPLTCCVSFGEAGFDIVTLTGNVRIGENGEPEYEATDGVWYQDFADAGRCTGGSTPCNGQLLASGECCESPNEVFQGQCVPPCPAGQQRNANGVCETPRQPEPTPCPTGQVRNANGVCVVPACPDEDKDGICDADDNCVFNPNENQTDSDNDGSGDPCDPCTDADQDLFCEIPGTPANDNCWGIYNPDQTDRDGDGVGDACDNCPTVQNADQTNTDGIGPGDECEEPECPRDANGGNGDLDGDGVCNSDDNCVRVANPNQEDRDDLDGWGDACDNCPDTYNPDQADTFGEPGVGDKCEQQQCPNGTASVPPDLDNDGVCNSDDNCPNNANPGQADSDGDNRGDVCDFCPGANGNVPTPNTPNPSPGYLYDTDNNGVLDSCFPGTGSFTNN